MLSSIANKNVPEIRYSSFQVVGKKLAVNITHKGAHTVHLLKAILMQVR